MLSITTITELVLQGKVTSENITHWSHYYWDSGEFIHWVKLDKIRYINADGPSTARYGGVPEVGHQILYGEYGSPGCVVVDAPADTAYQGNFGDMLVPPHAHDSDHVAIVLSGNGTFVVQREVDGHAVVLLADARPGMMAFYPAHVPHSFICGPNGIRVASAQAEYESPVSQKFAYYVGNEINELPRLKYDSYLARFCIAK
jgi:hypothetical protein